MKHTIEIDGLPEGWEPVAYRKPIFGEYYFYNDDIVQGKTGCGQFLIVKKKQPRRIVLEETDDTRSPKKGDYYYYRGCLRRWSKDNHSYNTHKIWRIAEDSGENNND